MPAALLSAGPGVNLPLAALGSLLAGGAVTAAGLWAYAVAVAPREDHLLPSELERDRRRLLRKRSNVYRWYEPVVDLFAGFYRRQFAKAVADLERDLVMVEPPAPRDPIERWHPEEFLALKQVIGLGIGICVGGFITFLFDPLFGLMAAFPIAAIYPWSASGDVKARANMYRTLVRSRLAMVIDLMALMLEAEATVYQCVSTVAAENKGHPIGELFAVLADSIRRSVPQEEALKRMAEMIDDSDLNDLVFTLTATGQSSGLKEILRAMTGPMRVRRIQALEQASERAKVNITFPAMIIMCACLLIVLAVFALPAASQ